VATLLLVPITPAGGRLLYVATHWSAYRRQRDRIWRRSEGGLAMYGGVPAMLLASLPVLSWMGLPYWAYWDVSVYCLLVAMIFFRLGCFLHGCCAGAPTDGQLGIWLPDERGVWDRRLPNQLLEVGWTLALLAAAILVWPWRPYPGALFLGTLAGYGIGRLHLQPTRSARERIVRIDLPWAISAATIILSIAGLVAVQP
jgi:phosphatidylglycerol:prolipoprotein diacylglycerol transferase